MEDLKVEFVRLISFLKPAGYDDQYSMNQDLQKDQVEDNSAQSAERLKKTHQPRYGGLLDKSSYPRKESKQSNYQLDFPEDFEDMHTRPHFQV